MINSFNYFDNGLHYFLPVTEQKTQQETEIVNINISVLCYLALMEPREYLE